MIGLNELIFVVLRIIKETNSKIRRVLKKTVLSEDGDEKIHKVGEVELGFG